MSKDRRPPIPELVKKHLWLRAGGRCEFRGCNRILYEDDITQDPINESNIAHIISWTPTGPRGDIILSEKRATDIENLMLVCPDHNHLIDAKDQVKKYTVALLEEMKREHEEGIRRATELNRQLPKTIIELKSMIHGQRPSITLKEESDALFPFYPKADKIVIDLCDVEDLATAKRIIDQKVKKHFSDYSHDEQYAAFIMALIPYGCYLGYAIGNKVPVQTFQHFRDTENWKWKDSECDYTIALPQITDRSTDVNLFISISGQIDPGLVPNTYPTYAIDAETPSFDFLQSWDQVTSFRKHYRKVLDQIRNDQGEDVTVHLFPATPNPINFEIGKGIMKNLDPTIVLYDKTSKSTAYIQAMVLHERIR